MDTRGSYRRRLPWIGRVPTQGSPAVLRPTVAVVRPPTPALLYQGRVYLTRVPTQGRPAVLLPRVLLARPATPAVAYGGRVIVGRLPGQGQQSHFLRPILVAQRRPGPPPGLAVFTRPPRADPPPPATRIVRGAYVVPTYRLAFAARAVGWFNHVGQPPPLPDHGLTLPASVRTQFILAASARTMFSLLASVRTRFRLEARE